VFVPFTFTSDGLLPAGVHVVDWPEFAAFFGHNDRRRRLLTGLRDVAVMLAAAGCSKIWVDGSFVTDRDEPGDYDACWDWQGVDPASLDPLILNYTPVGRLAMKAKYLGDLFIAHAMEGKSNLPFLAFFQQSRDGKTKGIVQLDPRRVR
jgi:hypothetical protein